MDMWDFWIQMGTTAILQSIKNPDKRAGLKRIMLKLYTSIGNAYIGDPDFTQPPTPPAH